MICGYFWTSIRRFRRPGFSGRNVPPQWDRFFDTWIPLEQAYFQPLDPKGQCDLVLEVEA